MTDPCAGDVSPESAFTPAFTTETQPARASIVKSHCDDVVITPAPGETPPVVEEIEVGAGAGLREFQEEFETSTHSLSDNASSSKRPDALSFDYLLAYALGPVAVGVVTEGAAAYVWRIRADNTTHKLYLCRELDAGWDTEIELFNYSFVGDVTEIDLAFEQAARAVVCLSTATNVWLYWFDPTLLPTADFVLEDFGLGRTPRLLLDNPADTTDSDVLFFYILDGTGIVYRTQRDRYETQVTTPITDVENSYLEEVFRGTDNRVVVVYSVHNPTLGQYTLKRLESTLYPYISDIDNFEALAALLSGIFEQVVLTFEDDDEIEAGASLISGTLAEILIDHILFDIDNIETLADITAGTLVVVVLTHTAFDLDNIEALAALTAGTLVLVVIEHTCFDIDNIDTSVAIQGGTLAAP